MLPKKVTWSWKDIFLWQIWRYFRYERCYRTAAYGFRHFLHNDFPFRIHGTEKYKSIATRCLQAERILPLQWDRAIAQAVIHGLPTAAARVRARVWSCGICGGQSGAGTGFLQVLRLTLPIFIPPIAPQSPSSITLICHLGLVQWARSGRST
jgi:hypothetical protein